MQWYRLGRFLFHWYFYLTKDHYFLVMFLYPFPTPAQGYPWLVKSVILNRSVLTKVSPPIVKRYTTNYCIRDYIFWITYWEMGSWVIARGFFFSCVALDTLWGRRCRIRTSCCWGYTRCQFLAWGRGGCVALPGIRSMHMCDGVWSENTLGLCEKRQSAMNYTLCFNKMIVASVLALARVKRGMLSVGSTDQQSEGQESACQV